MVRPLPNTLSASYINSNLKSALFLVFEILLKVSEGKPWKETLLEVLPQRKFRIGGRKRKHKSNNSTNESDSEDGNSTEDESNREESSKEIIAPETDIKLDSSEFL